MSACLLPKVLGMFTAISPALVAAKFSNPLRAPLRFKGPKWVWDCLVVPPYLSLAFLSFLWYQVEANEGRLSLSPNDLQLLTTDASEPRKKWSGLALDANGQLVTMGARLEGDQTCFSIAALELKNLSSSGSPS